VTPLADTINFLHAFGQNHIAVIGEAPTAGYNLLKAEISYRPNGTRPGSARGK